MRLVCWTNWPGGRWGERRRCRTPGTPPLWWRRWRQTRGRSPSYHTAIPQVLSILLATGTDWPVVQLLSTHTNPVGTEHQLGSGGWVGGEDNMYESSLSPCTGRTVLPPRHWLHSNPASLTLWRPSLLRACTALKARPQLSSGAVETRQSHSPTVQCIFWMLPNSSLCGNRGPAFHKWVFRPLCSYWWIGLVGCFHWSLHCTGGMSWQRWPFELPSDFNFPAPDWAHYFHHPLQLVWYLISFFYIFEKEFFYKLWWMYIFFSMLQTLKKSWILVQQNISAKVRLACRLCCKHTVWEEMFSFIRK